MKRVFAIRPEPGLSSTIAAGAARGLPITGFALSGIRPCGWTLPDLSGIDGLLVGSANAFRHGGEKLEALQHLPVLAVGQATAEVAEEAGFAVSMIGSGGLQSLLNSLPDQPRHLLRLSGEKHVELEPPPHIKLTSRIVYRVQNTDIPDDFSSLLAQGGVVLLHSAGAAKHFADECDRLGLDRRNIALAALGMRILGPAGMGWRDVRAAPSPEESELLALAQDMCQ